MTPAMRFIFADRQMAQKTVSMEFQGNDSDIDRGVHFSEGNPIYTVQGEQKVIMMEVRDHGSETVFLQQE